jgi:hypothetical protein
MLKELIVRYMLFGYILCVQKYNSCVVAIIGI